MPDRDDLPAPPEPLAYAAAYANARRARPEPANAILYAQYHLKGGLRNTLIGMGVTVAVFAALFGIALSSDSRHPKEIAKAMVAVLPVVQMLVLGLYGASRVAGAVRQDVSLGLIESHRLTPTPPLAAAFGYVLGPPLQAFAVALVLFVCGLATCLMADVPLTFWLTANAMAVVLSLSLYVVTALIGFSFASAAAMPIILIGSIVSSSLFLLVPALTVLTCPLIGQSVFNMIGSRSAGVPPAYGFAVVGHVLLGGVLLIAIARRYRNADTPAFSTRLGLLLLLLWTAVTLVGMLDASLFLPQSIYYTGREADTNRLTAAVISCVLVALVPLGAVARRLGRVPASVTPADAASADDPAGDDRVRGEAPGWLAVLGIVALCVAPAVAYELGSLGAPHWPRLAGTGVVIAATCFGVVFTLAWQHLAGRPGRFWLLLFLALPNALPPVLNLVWTMNTPEAATYSPIVAFSPIGSLLMLWDRQPVRTVDGVTFQALLVLLPLGLYLSRRRSLTASRPLSDLAEFAPSVPSA